MSWQTVPQPRTCSSKASVSIAAAGPSDDTVPEIDVSGVNTTKIYNNNFHFYYSAISYYCSYHQFY